MPYGHCASACAFHPKDLNWPELSHPLRRRHFLSQDPPAVMAHSWCSVIIPSIQEYRQGTFDSRPDTLGASGDSAGNAPSPTAKGKLAVVSAFGRDAIPATTSILRISFEHGLFSRRQSLHALLLGDLRATGTRWHHQRQGHALPCIRKRETTRPSTLPPSTQRHH